MAAFTVEDMGQRIALRVVGFSDVERHALNTLVRLSEEQATAYGLWTPEAGDPPGLLLIDGESYESALALAQPLDGCRLIWVGPNAPPLADRVFQRPLVWPQLLTAMNELMGIASVHPVDLDLDLLIGDGDTAPGALPTGPRALIVHRDAQARLYLRARLAIHGYPVADEAATAQEALALATSQVYPLVTLGLDLPDAPPLVFIDQLRGLPTPPRIVGLLPQWTLAGWWSLRRRGVAALADPPDPYRLASVLGD